MDLDLGGAVSGWVMFVCAGIVVAWLLVWDLSRRRAGGVGSQALVAVAVTVAGIVSLLPAGLTISL